MKIPYHWIREFVDLQLTAEQARDRLVNAGIEVSSLSPIAPDIKGVVVGEIEAIERELGGLALEPDAPLGADLVSHLGLDDVVLEIEITPNRPDCLSVFGIARELAALTGAPLRTPRITVPDSDVAPEARLEDVNALARVRIDDPDLCHRFTARVISDVKVGPSPAWMAARLRAVG